MPAAPPPCRWVLPDPAAAEPGQEVLAIGADLEPSTLFAAYSHGLFPMHLESGELAWWSPDPRGVLPLDALRVTRSLRGSCRRYSVTVDTAFADVMAACGDPRRPQGWITSEFVDAYTTLHRMGWAHSVEVWDADGSLVGGLYGVSIGGLFAGESMFHTARDASKVALVALVAILAADGQERLLDVQWVTDHLASLGVIGIPRSEYLSRLEAALVLPSAFATQGR